MSNLNRIIQKSNINSIELNSEIYKNPIFFFNNYEKKGLLAIREVLRNLEFYFDKIYIPIVTVDTLSYVYEGQKPSYHKALYCEKMKLDFKNFTIPKEIKNKGKEAVVEFRTWFESVKDIYERDPENFVSRLYSKYKIVTNPKAISRQNSGAYRMENYSANMIEELIDEKIKQAGQYYYQSPKNTNILQHYSKKSYLAYKEIKDNTTDYSDNEVKDFLLNYDQVYKLPLKKMLIEYYRIKFNPYLDLNSSILEQLGFRSCLSCIDFHLMLEDSDSIATSDGNEKLYKEKINLYNFDMEIDDLPF